MSLSMVTVDEEEVGRRRDLWSGQNGMMEKRRQEMETEI